MANASVATYTGRSIIWNRMIGNGTPAKYIGWGTGYTILGGGGSLTGSANPNVNLFGPAGETRATGTPTGGTFTALADTYSVVGTITCTAAKTITEAGLFDSSTLSQTTTLVSSLTAAATTATFGATLLPTSGNFYVQVENETILCTGANSATLTVARGALNSTSATHASLVATTVGGDGGAQSLSVGTAGGCTVASLGGSMFVHADFAGIALNSADSIAFTFSDTLT